MQEQKESSPPCGELSLLSLRFAEAGIRGAQVRTTRVALNLAPE